MNDNKHESTEIKAKRNVEAEGIEELEEMKGHAGSRGKAGRKREKYMKSRPYLIHKTSKNEKVCGVYSETVEPNLKRNLSNGILETITLLFKSECLRISRY